MDLDTTEEEKVKHLLEIKKKCFIYLLIIANQGTRDLFVDLISCN